VVGVQAHWYGVLEIVVVTVTVGPEAAVVEVGKTLSSFAPMIVLSSLEPVPVPVFM
jgi:hypothetical protein